MGLFPMSPTQVTVLVVMAMAIGGALGLIAGLWLFGYSTASLDQDDFRDDEL